jgi:hypothetical protein
VSFAVVGGGQAGRGGGVSTCVACLPSFLHARSGQGQARQTEAGRKERREEGRGERREERGGERREERGEAFVVRHQSAVVASGDDPGMGCPACQATAAAHAGPRAQSVSCVRAIMTFGSMSYKGHCTEDG